MHDSSGLVLVLRRVSYIMGHLISIDSFIPAPSRPDPGLLLIIIFLLTL